MTAPAAAPSRGYIPRAGKSDWRTPPEVVERLHLVWGGPPDLDPCASVEASLAKENWTGPAFGGLDGLAQPWGERSAYVNPPFDGLAAWSAKCALEHRERRSEVILLLPSRTDTAYWHEHLASAALICLWRGRLKFVGAPAPCPFPVSFAYWGGRPALFHAAFAPKGMVVAP